jgi:hypothetical protein
VVVAATAGDTFLLLLRSVFSINLSLLLLVVELQLHQLEFEEEYEECVVVGGGWGGKKRRCCC